MPPAADAKWIKFLVVCLIVAFLVLFFLFYINRIFASFLSRLIRIYTWRKYRAYIEIESIQFAPLAGRILFKNVKYRSINQSFLILKGHVTVRYWLWKVRKECQSQDNNGSNATDNVLPCRIVCCLQGVEWFAYNRTPAYDAVDSIINKALNSEVHSDRTSTSNMIRNETEDITVNLNGNDMEFSEESFFQKLLPIEIDLENGSIIFGNANTPSLLVAEFSQTNGIYTAVKSRSRFDYYKSFIKLQFREPKIHLRRNIDYKEPTLSTGARTEAENMFPRQTFNEGFLFEFQNFYKKYLIFWKQYGLEDDENSIEWHGLPRYPFYKVSDEYAKVSTILTCDFLEMIYYADVVGKVPRNPIPITDSEEIDIGNGDLSPEWGVDLMFTRVQLDYGPWADRQRSILQNFFFPPVYRNGEQTKKLSPGQDRLHTSLKILIQFKGQVTLRIPLKEASKDWKYSNSERRIEESQGNNRPYGWLEVKINKDDGDVVDDVDEHNDYNDDNEYDNDDNDSFINISLPMVFTEQGYSNSLEMVLENVVIQSSVNFSHLLTTKQCKLKCDLKNPLIWNQARKWNFDMYFTDAKIYLLRDHITLLQDLIKDWTSGPSLDQLHFIPMEYQFNPRFTNFELFLYVNEHNIINNPMDIEDNAFIIIKGPQLVAEVVIPLLHYNQEITKIRFNVEIDKGRVAMSPQVSQTLGAFLTGDSKEFVQMSSFMVEGTYQYYSFVHPSHVESLSLIIKGKEVNLKLFGFVIRYFLILQMNYFGNYINFMTLDEYTKHDPKNTKKPQEVVKPPADPFEVYMILSFEDGTLILPENLYNADNSSTIQFHELQVELRNLDIYMDMDVTVSPLMWTLSSDASLKKNTLRSKVSGESNNYLYIDDLNIYAHRLFGPLPKTTTYVCNWDINIGTISGQLKPSFLLSATTFAKTFVYHFVDKENALPAEYMIPLDPDVTFLTLVVKEVDVSIRGRDSLTQILLTEGLNVKFDDLANAKYTQKVIFNLPDIMIRSLAMAVSSIDSSKDVENYPWVEVARFECASNVTLYHTTSGWRERFESQQAFIKKEDSETLRVPFLYGKGNNNQDLLSNGQHFGSLYVPPMPPPLPDDMDDSTILCNESTNSSVVDLSANQCRRDMLNLGRRYGFKDFDSYDEESWPRPDDDSFSIDESGVSVSNASFVTASDGDEEDEIDFIDELCNTHIKIGGDSDIEYEDELDQSPIYEPQYPNSPPLPRSIPYGNYLRRYKVTSKRSSPAPFSSSFLRPSRTLFEPARSEKPLSPDDENSQSYKSSPFTKTRSSSTESSEACQLEDEITSSQNNDTEEKSTIIFETTKCIKVFLTPIFLKIVKEFLEAIKDENWNLEAMLDKIQIDYVDELTKLFPFKYTTIRYAVSIPRVHFHFIQDVLLPDDLTNVNDEHSDIRTRYDLTDTILCAAADLIFDQALLTGLLKFEDKKFDSKDKKNFRQSLELIESRANIDFDALKLNVRFVAGSNSVAIFGIPEYLHQFKESGFMSSDILDNEPVVLIVSLEQFKLKWLGCMQPNYFSFDIDNIGCIFISQSAEILLGGIYWWLVFAEDLANLLKKFQTHRTRQQQVLVYEIAKFSEKARIESDPPYLTRPSHVLRLGTKNFKNDDGWKILGRVRHCKRLMEREQIDNLHTKLNSNNSAPLLSTEPNDMYERVVRVFSGWRHWEMENLSNCILFIELYQNQTENLNRTSINTMNNIYRFLTTSTNIAKVRIQSIFLSVWDGQKENSVTVNPIELNLETTFHKDNFSSSEVTRKQTDLNSNNTEQEPSQIITAGNLDVILRIGIDHMELYVNPDILAFAKHWLEVHRIFSSKFQSQPEEVVSSTKAHKHKSTTTITSFHDVKISKIKEKKRKDTAESISSDPIRDLLSRLNICARGIFVLKTIIIKASVQNLMAQTQLTNIQVSSWLNNPQLLNSGEKSDLENVSVNKSTLYPGSKGSGSKGSNMLIFTIIAGIGHIFASITESSSSGTNNNLFSIEFSRISSNTSLSLLTPGRQKSKIEIEPRKVLNILLTLETISVKLPHSLLKLYHFFEEWRSENLSRYDFLYNRLLDELEEKRKSTPKYKPDNREIRISTEKNSRNSLEISFQFLMKKFSIQTHMLPSLRFHYDAWDLIILIEKRASVHGDRLINYSGQLKKQFIHFVTRQKNKSKSAATVDEETNDNHQKGAFTIPAIRATGNIKPYDSRKSCMSTKKTAVSPTSSIPPHKYSKLESLVTLDFVKLNLNVNIIDNLLTAHSTLGSELNDVLDMFLFSSKRLKERGGNLNEKASTSVTATSPKENDILFYNLTISLRGLRISAMSPTAIGFFETNILNGLISNVPLTGIEKSPKVQWKFSAQNLSLSLNHNTGVISQAEADDDIRKYRIAYIMIDLVLQNFKTRKENSESISKYNECDESIEPYFLKLLKVHAVMQPIALGRLMDLYVYYSGELERRKKMKASDINKLTANTRRILNSLDVEMPKYKSKSKSFLDEKVISLEVTRFAIALPLVLSEDLISTAAQIPAFLFSISSMNFLTRKWKSNCAILRDLSLQFVTQFDQGNENHFSYDFHTKMNLILIPEISCEGHTTGTIDKKKVYVESRVEGFEIDVGGNIVNHINSLGEIYAASRERLETFTAEANFNLGSQSPKSSESENGELDNGSGSNFIELEVDATFTAKSGTIKLYPKNYFTKHHSRRPTGSKVHDRSRSARGSHGSIASIPLPRLNLDGLSNYAPTNLDDLTRQGEHGIDIIVIPGLSLNTFYRTTIGQRVVVPSSDSLTKRVHVELIIHPSKNMFYPSLVPFFKDIIDGLKIGVQRSSDKKAIAVQESSSSIQGMNITCYFRLSRTTFDLSCQPASKVLCSLKWEEGNFLISSNTAEEAAQSVTCVGKIRGASGNIRHSFSPEDCVKAETKDISFNATLMSRRTESVSDDSISIIVELPQIAADLNIRHLQDLLLLKTIWIDQATKLYEVSSLNSQQPSRPVSGEDINGGKAPLFPSSPTRSITPLSENETKVKPYSVYVIVKLNQLDLSSDLGQAIGKIRFNTKNIQVCTKNVPGSLKEATASIDNLDIQCEGRLTGSANMKGLTFTTILGIPPSSETDGLTCVTNLLFKTERIQSSLEYEYQKILVLDADPMQFKLADSWKIISPEKASVLIHAKVSIKRIQAIVSIKTIPVFLYMMNKLLNLVEEKRISASNVISNSKRSSPLNPNSQSQTIEPNRLTLPETSLKSSSFKELSVGGLFVYPVGKITIAMEKVHLTIFPNHFHDTDCVQTRFDGLLVDMKRSIREDNRINRELDMQLNGIALLKSNCKKLNHKHEKSFTFQNWFDHVETTSSKNIFTLPNTHLIMDTTQGIESNIVDHKFAVDFKGKVDVALNFGLIRYLQELGASYKEQLRKNAVGTTGELPRSPIIPIVTPLTPGSTPIEFSKSDSLIQVQTSPTLPESPKELKAIQFNENEDSKESKKKDAFIFNPIEPVKLEPQLRILGDATPPLEWVGVQRAKVPGFVHTEITMNLDEIINQITNESVKAAKALL
ncbi:14436_t:CDS:10 [Funneliformis mosseae]|uniref:14436_t:CDS:1 n=1 Tax=Funneliformis mosseae TaxID=27381 RepID=A0A9N8YQ80_FUNMO|nr:14436_t:CDS:10 [Funneliformis mosseae]